jgi:hypothetical protein
MQAEGDKDEYGYDCNRGRQWSSPALPQKQTYAGKHVEKAAQKIEPQHESDCISDLGTRGGTAKKCTSTRPYGERAKQSRYDSTSEGPARAAECSLADVSKVHPTALPSTLNMPRPTRRIRLSAD